LKNVYRENDLEQRQVGLKKNADAKLCFSAKAVKLESSCEIGVSGIS
jgi:hypothetical protein